ncbi:MAG: restriction endonuclease subunit S [Spirochaetia bacterium]|jgi:very-short-patch-repair endonuclease/restriction endonuclease S subunit|nr:restriction endonuclease subunit S [Spirochaetia bacterium]
MGSEWKTITLEDFSLINPTESLKKGESAKKIAMDSLGTFQRKISSFAVANFNGGTKFKNGDTLLARITPCLENGKTAYVDILDENEIAFGSTEYIVFRERKGISDKKFLYYLCISPSLRSTAIQSMTGSSGRQRIQTDVIKKSEFIVPPLHEQKSIAHILGSLDDKIELNRKMNETLESMAQALFKSWFVDFDPVIDNALEAGNAIPEELKERAEVRRRMLSSRPSPPTPLPWGEGRENVERIHYRGGFNYSGLVEFARELRKSETDAEKFAWQLLRNRKYLDLKFRRQHQIGFYIVDFYCDELKLVLELDGSIHQGVEQKKKDLVRDTYLKSEGFTVLRFSNNTVLERTEKFLIKIKNIADSYSSPSGRGRVRDGLEAKSANCKARPDSEPSPPTSLPRLQGRAGSLLPTSPEGRKSYKVLPDEMKSLFPSEFEFTDEMGWVPLGWKVKTLDELINLIGGGTPKTSIEEYWNGNIPWFSVVDAPKDTDIYVINTEKHITELGVEKSSTNILPVGTTIISARGTVGKCAMVGKPMAMNQSCYGIHGKNNISDSFIYYTIREQVSGLQRSGHGSVFNTITRDTFKTIKIAFSETKLTNEFEKSIKPYLDKIFNNCFMNETLINLRDTLLPKLLSGEISIPDIEKLLEGPI